MKALKERILRDGKCFEGGILKVDNFINHQMDPILMKSIAVEFVRRFASTNINKVMTIEASGIAPAIMVGYLLELPVVFAKKKKPVTMEICSPPVYIHLLKTVLMMYVSAKISCPKETVFFLLTTFSPTAMQPRYHRFGRKSRSRTVRNGIHHRKSIPTWRRLFA